MKSLRGDARPAPLITIVTPALNAAAFLDETLASVSAQNRDDIEHIIVDGGSTDATRAIVARYPGTRFVEQPGSKQTAAMNAGAALAAGTFLIFLNADDVLVPGAADALAAAFADDDTLDVVYGRAEQIDAAGALIEHYPTRAFDAAALLESCFVCQAGSMIRRASFERAGGFTTALNFSMDYDLWLRIAPWARFAHIDALTARVRLHDAAKTIAQRERIFAETFDILLSRAGYVPYTWIYADADHRLERGTHAVGARRKSRGKVLYALYRAVAVNRRQPLRAIRDWLAHRA